MKEFSNNPSEAMTELSSIFETRMKLVQESLLRLKTELDATSEIAHSTQHYRLVLQSLTKMIQLQVITFKRSLTSHAKHVEQRQKRIHKYGGLLSNALFDQSMDQKSGSGSKYALFSSEPITAPSILPLNGTLHAEKHLSILRNRKGCSITNVSIPSSAVNIADSEKKMTICRTPTPCSSSVPRRETTRAIHNVPDATPYSLQALRLKKSNDNTRLQQAHKTEQSIQQVRVAHPLRRFELKHDFLLDGRIVFSNGIVSVCAE
jgi:hypothetical protein